MPASLSDLEARGVVCEAFCNGCSLLVALGRVGVEVVEFLAGRPRRRAEPGDDIVQKSV